MLSKFIQFIAVVLISLITSSVPVLAAGNGEITKELWIGGYAYEARLTASQINGIAGSGKGVHYRGHFPEDPDSWVRVSSLESGWEGLAFVFNRLHTIRSGGAVDQVASFSFSHQDPPQCGMDHLHADASITPEKLVSPAMVQAVNASYDVLCADRVDGACLMLELELAFDQQFQDRFGVEYESRAGAILNMVEGFYADQFGIVFDTLSLTFVSDSVFSATTDSGALLGDIRDKRASGSLPFLESRQSVFHLVSGRNFDGSTAGLAYSGTVCNSQGFASGITNAVRSDATTAVIVAHEIGHNLGSGHDGSTSNGCPVDGKIMSPSVSGSASEFSSCSYQQITDRISSLSAVEQCFNFPADTGIEALLSNASEVREGDLYQGSFEVAYQDASQAADRIAIEGSIGEGEGRLEQVTLNGASCTLTSDILFNCGETQARSGLQLDVQITAGASPTLNIVQGVALVSDSGDVKDIRLGNDTLLTQISVTQADDSPPDETSTPDAPSNDSANDSTNDSESFSSSSSGGGGSAGWFWLLLGLAGMGRLSMRAW